MKAFEFKDFRKPYQNLFIEASAGTGKTYTIQLMVARLISEETPLKKILIVTYTEKAAGELKDRIRKKIDEVLEKGLIDKGEDRLTEEQLGYFRKAYQEVDNAAIFTIHSFCQKTLKEYAYDAGRPFDVGVVDDSKIEDLIDRFVRDVWPQNPEFQVLLSAEEDANAFVNRLKKKLKKSVDMYKGKGPDNLDIVKLDVGEFVWADDSISLDVAQTMKDEVKGEHLLQFKTFAQCLDVLEHSGVDSYRAEFESRGVLDVQPFSLPNLLKAVKSWKSTGANPFTQGKIGKKLIEVPEDTFGESLKYVFARLYELKDLQKQIKDFCENTSNHYEFLINATRELFEAWQKDKAEKKLQSYNDMILSVHKEVMSAGSSLKEKLRAQYLFAIIDEFQDTNQLQWDVFKSVFHEAADHSIFVVGDPKQSIYSFQGADVNVYQQAITKIGEGRLLENNYRSTNGIIEGCNILFGGEYFSAPEGTGQKIEFKPSLPPAEDLQKEPPKVLGEVIPSIWINEKCEPQSFAENVVTQIVNWCAFEGEKTKLQVFDKDFGKPGHTDKLKNVSFKDFAILAKSRPEMEFFKDAMRRAGIPYTHYKENSLFKSRECKEWVAIFNALCAPDFSYWNRRLLSEALITDFFHFDVDGLDKLRCIESDVFDRPDNKYRIRIYEWRMLALKHRYAEMMERVYKDSEIEKRLMDVSRLQSLARLRQIGNYAIDYLYNHKCSLEDLVRHLDGLARYEESADDENGDLVEQASDFDAVQLMTIHASKGLEFPVVISAAGFKHHYQDPIEPSLFHDKNDIYIGFGDSAKAKRKTEELEEWKRLFYVDFTRASSVLILPQYEKWTEIDKNGCLKYPEYQFLQNSIENFKNTCRGKCVDKTKIPYYGILPSVEDFEPNDLKEILISNIFKKQRELNGKECLGTKESAVNQMSSLQSKLTGKAILQYSYSSLASRVAKPDAENKTDDNEIENADESRADKDDSSPISSEDDKSKQKEIDPEVISNVTDDDDYDEAEPLSQAEEKYPRGAKIGNVLHNTLEKSEFENFVSADGSLKALQENIPAKLKNIIKEEFHAESLPLADHEKEWMDITLRYLYNTLHAALPVIAGGEFVKSVEPFHLIELDENAHKPEVQFGLNADVKNESTEAFATLHRVCKGFIDLLFVRGEGDNKRYSILDWKSDFLDDYSPRSVKDKVNEEYSVQRVLYSYCLIKWLKNFEFCKGLSEQEIFDKHFGGIYYAFLRGTDGKTGKGIYAQTWKDYRTLEAAYENVKDLMTQGEK